MADERRLEVLDPVSGNGRTVLTMRDSAGVVLARGGAVH
jgi:hypothetical protein